MRELVKDTTNRNLGKRLHKCKLCGTEGMFDAYLVKEMMQDSQEEFEYFVCTECNCLQIAEIPSELGRYYGKDYYSFAQKEFPDFQYEAPVIRRDRILDVGCGSGTWLFRKALSGYGNLYGGDSFLDKNMHYGDRVHIPNCSIYEIKGDASFGEIRISDAFEHMTDPIEVLESAARLLKPGAVLAMGVPFYEQTRELLSRYFTEEDIRGMVKTNHNLNQIGYSDHAKVYWMHQDADENAQKAAC